MSAWARPGVKCVCIDGGTATCNGAILAGAYPITGQTYTIVATRQWRDELLLVFAEIPDIGPKSGWNASRFRPLVTRTQEQDMAIFRPLLETIGEDA